MKQKKILLIALLLSLIICSCQKDPLTDFEYFDSIISTTELSKKDLLIKLNMNPNSAIGALLPNRTLKTISIRYKTKDPQGKDIFASGLLTYATTTTESNAMGSVLAVHFTMGANYEVPSQKHASHESLFALFGYVVVAPDYIGYGETKDKTHPYHHYENTGRVSTDLLFAAKEYFASLNKRFPKALTIMGYSEGGYASLACLKYIQENYDGWLNVKHVYSGAGAYDLLSSYDEFVKRDYSSQPVTIPMLMLGLNYGDNLEMDYTKIFKKKLLDNYKEWILSKKYTTDTITAKFGETKLTNILAPEAFDRTHPNTVKFLNSLKKNSIVDWTPRSPITLIHGDEDSIVPIINSQKAYESFKKRGCDVTFHIVKGKDHKPAGNDFYTYCLLKMLTSPKGAEDNSNDQIVKSLENMSEPLFNL